MKVLAFAMSLLALAVCVSRTSLQAETPTSSASAVSILPQPGLGLVEKNTYRDDAGSVDTILTSHWESKFTLKNTTTQPITITRLRGSCGCETLLLLKDGATVPTVRLKPGEQADVHLKVALQSGQAGAVRKYVWIDGPEVAAGQTALLATLEVDLRLVPSVTFTPGFLSFGKVEAGAGASQSLSVTFDPDLFHGADLPVLRSSSPDLQARPIGLVQSIAVEGKPRLRQTYQVTLSPAAHSGQISGDLGFDLPKSSSDLDHVSHVHLSLSGEVAGALDALPASVFFGSLPAGTSVTRSVVLSTATAQNASALTVTSSAPWLRATLDPSPLAARHRLLSIILTSKTPLGSIQEKVTVGFGKADHLDIPVIAELTK